MGKDPHKADCVAQLFQFVESLNDIADRLARGTAGVQGCQRRLGIAKDLDISWPESPGFTDDVSCGQKDGNKFCLEYSGIRRESEGSSVVFIGSLIQDVAGASTFTHPGSIHVDIQLARSSELSGAREAVRNYPVPGRRVNGTEVVSSGGYIDWRRSSDQKKRCKTL